MPEAILNVLSPRALVSAEDIGIVFKSLCNYPALTPEVWDAAEPMRIPFDRAKVGQIADRISTSRPNGPSGFMWRRRKPRSWGALYADHGPIPQHGRAHLDANVGGGIDQSEIISFFKDLSRDLGADFGFLEAKPPVNDPSRPSLFAHTRDLIKGIPQLFWATIFGPPYTDLFGKDCLNSVPAAVRTELAPNLFYIQLTERLNDAFEQPDMVDKARRVVKEHLGIEAFADVQKSDLPRRVPKFSFPFNPRRAPMPQPKPRRPRSDGLEETSTSFDLETLSPFLEKIVSLVDSGFAVGDAHEIIEKVKTLPVEAATAWNFPIVVGGKKSLLKVRIFMDDVAAPDVYFTTDPALCQRIRAMIEDE